MTETAAVLGLARNASGGWGWRPGGPGSTECTALALCALDAHRRHNGVDEAIERGAAWLRASQNADGSWPTGEQVPGSGWAGALAVLALARLDPEDRQAVLGAEWLLGRKSRGIHWLERLWRRFSPGPDLVDQDPHLIGWPWTADTAAWVEPTAWSLLAVKQMLPLLHEQRAADRISQGEKLLEDRMCYGGGWNYGNRKVLGEELAPYPDTTALALIALHDRASSHATAPSLRRLEQMLSGQRSSLVLALSTLSLQLHDNDVTPLRAELRERLPDVVGQGDVRTLALALLALDETTHHFQVVRT